ncbi:MAG: hypothetical protein K2N06_10725 [Oscillospiraceae bacterium]|nr:hypothetical protein [Oscillospiraceae bacterium]
MIKATIQNSPYCTEIRFPCSETELSKKLGELSMNPEHLAPMATVLEIEPAELSVLEDCEVSLDALNFLGKRMDGMCKAERNQFLAVLSCDELEIGYGLKNIINLTYNLARYTLIEDTDDLERVGRTHMLNVRGFLSKAEYSNSEWLSEEGMKLLDSGSGIDTEYGKIFVNEEIPFEEIFNGTTFPAYLCESNSVAAIEIGYMDLTEMVELPCEEIAIKKALARLGADKISDCKIEVDSTRNISYEWSGKISEIEKTKDLFGLNKMLKSEDIRLKQEQPMSIFKNEVIRKLDGEGYDVSADGEWLTVTLNSNAVVKINDSDIIYTDGDFYDKDKSEAAPLSGIVRGIYEYCSSYEKAPPLKAADLSGNYRCLSEFNGTVLAAKYNADFGFEFVTWDRTYDGKAVRHGNYYGDYAAAKENFAVRSGLVDGDKLFDNSELDRIQKCVKFAMENDGNLHFDEYDNLQRLCEKISESVSVDQRSTREQQQDEAPKMSM